MIGQTKAHFPQTQILKCPQVQSKESKYHKSPKRGSNINLLQDLKKSISSVPSSVSASKQANTHLYWHSSIIGTKLNWQKLNWNLTLITLTLTPSTDVVDIETKPLILWWTELLTMQKQVRDFFSWNCMQVHVSVSRWSLGGPQWRHNTKWAPRVPIKSSEFPNGSETESRPTSPQRKLFSPNMFTAEDDCTFYFQVDSCFTPSQYDLHV